MFRRELLTDRQVFLCAFTFKQTLKNAGVDQNTNRRCSSADNTFFYWAVMTNRQDDHHWTLECCNSFVLRWGSLNQFIISHWDEHSSIICSCCPPTHAWLTDWKVMKLAELGHDITVFASFRLHQFTQLGKKRLRLRSITPWDLFSNILQVWGCQHAAAMGKKGQTATKRFHSMQKHVLYSFQFLEI